MKKLDKSTQWRRVALTAALAANVEGDRVDRTGGQFGAGLIRGVSVLTRGEALGHYFWCDTVMLDQCLAFMQADPRGLKCRFTHPGMCSDGLAKSLGLFLNPARVGDQVIADLHFNNFAHRSPDGDLATYIMDRATEDPEHFGTSIVFCSDWDAEDEFVDDNEQQTEGKRSEFVSPDPDNVENLPHARIAELLACDCVDDPAANPSGLFHRDLSTIQAAEGFLDYALGLSTDRPTTVSFGVDPERARQFITDYAVRRGFSLPTVLKEGHMPKILKKGKLSTGGAPAADPTKPEEKPPVEGADATPEGAVTCPDCGAVFMPDAAPEPITDTPQSPGEYAANHGKYVAAFGAENGSKWFLSGMKFDAAQVEHYKLQLAAKDVEITKLKAEVEDAKRRLEAVAGSGEKPLDSSPPPAGTEGKKKASLSDLIKPAGSK